MDNDYNHNHHNLPFKTFLQNKSIGYQYTVLHNVLLKTFFFLSVRDPIWETKNLISDRLMTLFIKATVDYNVSLSSSIIESNESPASCLEVMMLII